jgi:metallo-beta-lactamase family protein
MLEGGPIHSYLNYGADKAENLIAITGYQVEETVGREILDGARKVRLFKWNDKGGSNVHINAEVRQFRFSGHAQRNELLKMLKAINSKEIVFVHGLKESAFALKNDLGNNFNVRIPEMKESIYFSD